jgi:hypothetical protein
MYGLEKFLRVSYKGFAQEASELFFGIVSRQRPFHYSEVSQKRDSEQGEKGKRTSKPVKLSEL